MQLTIHGVQGFGPTGLGPQAIISWTTGGLWEDSVRVIIPVNGRHATPRCGCDPTRCPAGLRSHARVLRIVQGSFKTPYLSFLEWLQLGFYHHTGP